MDLVALSKGYDTIIELSYRQKLLNRFFYVEIMQLPENYAGLKITELNRLDYRGIQITKKTPLVVVLDNVRSLHNVGSVFQGLPMPTW